MKTYPKSTTANLQKLERKINEKLSAMSAESRPELSSRRRVQSVAYAACSCFEATDSTGRVEMVKMETVLGWIDNLEVKR